MVFRPFCYGNVCTEANKLYGFDWRIFCQKASTEDMYQSGKNCFLNYTAPIRVLLAYSNSFKIKYTYT